MRRTAERLGDLARLSWGLWYWNVRKSVFRLRGATGPAPCQHPSDSGRAGQTGCEACRDWRDAGCFHLLCPLIASAPDGRRVCSVDARQVRPFWVRALALQLGAAAVLWLVAVAAAFVGLRAIGYRVPVYAVAWPPAWHRIHQARADYFYRMAVAAFSAGDVRQGFLALNQVYALDPANIEAATLLAQFTQIANPDYSDSIYTRLLLQRRGSTEEIAQAWYRALLSRGDFGSAGRLAARMLREGAPHAPAWIQGVLFAERMTGDPAELDRLLAGTAPLPAPGRAVLALARDLRSGGQDERRRKVALALGNSRDPFELYCCLEWLIDLGRPSDGVAFLEGPGAALLEAYDREALKLDAYSALGWRVLERKEIGSILEPGPSGAVVTLVAAHLIRHPDPAGAEAVFGLLEAKPLAGGPPNAGVHMALLCMAGVNGLEPRLEREAGLLGWTPGGKFAAWGRMQEFFTSAVPTKNPAVFLPALHPMPLEVVYAVAAHYRPVAR